MPVNDFDRGLIEKFEGHDFEYNPAQWERLSKALPVAVPERKRRSLWLPLSGIAAGLALLAASVAYLNQTDDHLASVAAHSPRTVSQPLHTAAAPAGPATAAPAPLSNTVAASPVAAPSAHNQSVSAIPSTILPKTVFTPVINPAAAPQEAAMPVSGTNPDVVVSSPLTTKPVTPVTLPQQAIVAPKEAGLAATPVIIAKAEPIIADAKPVPSAERFLAIDPDDLHIGRKKASLSLAGGYNQGNSNVGYMVGMNARKNLGGKLYVEGDIALSSNRNAQQTLSMPAETFEAYNNIAPQGLVASAKSANPAETVSDLYYLQVTPVVGYQVFRNWSLGAGADVQRLFQDRSKESFVIEDGAAKSMPAVDMGVVGKTEYTIYRSVKAGLQYRYGMNEVLAPGKNYINRSYLQVQLKVGILGSK